MWCTWAVLSSQALTLCQRSHDGSDSHGRATIGSNGSSFIWRMPRSLQMCAKGRGDGDPAVRMCDVDSWPGALR